MESADAHDGGDASHRQVVMVRPAGPDVGLVDVVGEHGVEGGDVARHAAHEGRHQSGEPDAQHAGGVELAPSGWSVPGRNPDRRSSSAGRSRRAILERARAAMPGTMTMKGIIILGSAAITGVRREADMELAAMARWITRKSVHQ